MGPMHDLVIRNAWLVDGTRAPARRASVAVAAGRIAAVGEARGATAPPRPPGRLLRRFAA